MRILKDEEVSLEESPICYQTSGSQGGSESLRTEEKCGRSALFSLTLYFLYMVSTYKAIPRNPFNGMTPQMTPHRIATICRPQ